MIRGYHKAVYKLCSRFCWSISNSTRSREGSRQTILWLFLCLQTDCCHVEMACSFDTDGFLNALTRMVARRGWPRDMLSDNGTNFIGGSKEIN